MDELSRFPETKSHYPEWFSYPADKYTPAQGTLTCVGCGEEIAFVESRYVHPDDVYSEWMAHIRDEYIDENPDQTYFEEE